MNSIADKFQSTCGIRIHHITHLYFPSASAMEQDSSLMGANPPPLLTLTLPLQGLTFSYIPLRGHAITTYYIVRERQGKISRPR